MPTSPIAKADVALRLITLLLLLVVTTCAQIFVIPTFVAIYAAHGLALPLSARLASGPFSFLGNQAVVLALVAGLGYMLWKRSGDAQQQLAIVSVTTLFFALLLAGQASLLLDLAMRRLTLGPVG